MDDNFWVEVSSEKPVICKKRKRRVGKRKIEFIGWGSRPLIEFLEEIGQDTTEKHSQHDVAACIAKYINEKGLANKDKKKKKVMCDERLQALFGKKSISRVKVFEMLEEHFAENHDDSDDELLDSSDEEDFREKSSLGLKNNHTGQMKKVPKTPKSCFAAVIPENIKLIYLKKSLIQELLKVPDSFETKIVGSFVRMKSDPNDIYQKNRFQLQQVTGVEKSSGGNAVGLEIRLRVSNFFKDIPISMLSDDNFSEEEIEDVRDRIKAGLLKRLNLNELESKAQMLHADITKHWIEKEISLLKNRIDHANEKGWRRELFDYIERRNMLQNPSEREKLLLKIPEVIAEELEPEETVVAASEKIEGSGCSPKSILRGSSDVSSTDASGYGDSLAASQDLFRDSHAPSIHNAVIDNVMPLKNPNGSGDSLAASQDLFRDSHAPSIHYAVIDDVRPPKNPNGFGDSLPLSQALVSDSHAPSIHNPSNHDIMPLKNPNGFVDSLPLSQALVSDSHAPSIYNPSIHDIMPLKNPNGSGDSLAPSQALASDSHAPSKSSIDNAIPLKNPNGHDETYKKSEQVPEIGDQPVVKSGEKCPQEKPKVPTVITSVIDLSDDESEDEASKIKDRSSGECPDDVIWYYVDPKGQRRGPFSLLLLKKWSDANYFHSGFTVWKDANTSNDGELLVDVIRRVFPP